MTFICARLDDAIESRLGVKATTCKAKAKDLTFKAKAKDLIPEDKVGYQNKY